MDTQKGVILITGANGAIGSAITRALNPSLQIVGLNRKCKGQEVDCVAIDLGSEESVHRALTEVRKRYGERIISIIHLAAYFDFTGQANPKYEEVNVKGTQRLLRYLQFFEVEQFVYASTMLVHAPTVPGQPINEDWPVQPKWPYPESKARAEKTVLEHHGNIPTVILRIAGVYTDHCHSPTLAHQIQRIYEKQLLSYLLPGNPYHGQSFVHLDDLVDVFPRLIERRGQLPNTLTLLIGEPVTVSYDELQDTIGHLIHDVNDWETYQVAKPAAKTGAWLQNKLEDIVPDVIDNGKEPFVKPFMIDLAEDHYELDISRARSYLGWTPQHSIRSTLPIMIEALQANPVGWYRENDLSPPSWLLETAENGQAAIDQDRVMLTRHRHTLWTHFLNMALGLWLLTSPFAMGYAQEKWMLLSDTFSGILVIIFSVLSLSRRSSWARWANGIVGLWLLFAPLAFWTGSAAAYNNDMLIGTLVICFALLVPPTPGISIQARMSGPDIPPDWDYCPSSWLQRIPIIALAFVGFFISRYLAAYQLGHIDTVWDPFFPGTPGKNGTETIITSSVSKAWPVSDAGLGALTYMMEILSGAIGSRRRWRTMPWVVILFGILIVPLGATSIFFIIIQPIVIGTWCALCLIAALAMLIQIPYSLDEIVATSQFLLASRRQGKPFWRTFFRGDTIDGGRNLEKPEFEASPGRMVAELTGGGVSIPWELLLCTLLGVWLMATQLTFGTQGLMAHSDHIVGALVITFSITAWAEVARPVRFINVPFGLWLMISPWVLPGESLLAALTSGICGILLIWLSLPRGRIRYHYAGLNRYLV